MCEAVGMKVRAAVLEQFGEPLVVEEVELGAPQRGEVLVRLHWRGVRIESLPTRVTYPEDGLSHFRLGLDNWLISKMHTRLAFGMLLRSPLLLWRKAAGR